MTPYDAEEVADDSLERDTHGAVTGYRCAACGDGLQPHEKHLVEAESTDVLAVFLFCGADCQRDWTSDQEPEEAAP